jgi:hypothetical protein
VDQGNGLVGEQLIGEADLLEVVADVTGGFSAGHTLRLVRDGDPLPHRRERAELDGVPARAADQNGGERGGGVHVVVVIYLELQINDLYAGTAIMTGTYSWPFSGQSLRAAGPARGPVLGCT